MLDISTLDPGWYSIVFCVSLKNMDTKALQSLTIDAHQLDDDNHAVYMAKTCKTIVGNEELRQIRKTKILNPNCSWNFKQLVYYSNFMDLLTLC